MSRLIKEVQVNIPFTMLHESYLKRFIKYGLNPEIGFDAAALDQYSLSDYSGIADQLHECGLTITLHAPFVDLSPGSPDPKVWAITQSRFEQILRLIPLFRPKTLVCHAGYDEKRYGYIRDIWVEKSLEMWSWLAKRVRDEGALLVLENVYEHRPDDIRFLFENLRDQRVGFCLDIGHQAAFSRAPLEKWIESLGQYIAQLHLHDNSGKLDEHQALGRGLIDFHMFFKKLVTMRKKPPIITLEPHREEHLWPSFEYLERIWPW
ncbi:MAG: sugar phosphate isomerase/epimerase [Proteobacteria bacterium]|nr:sugar phosphate isomerase/epimerase [Pseudomonadota bacterium]